MKRKILFLLFLFFGVVVGVVLTTGYPYLQTYQQKRTNVIRTMEQVIEQQVEKGNYRCCIDPACNMCFLGEWEWDDGICRCDDMIVDEEFDKVCPECKNQIKEGKCKYSEKSKCEIGLGELF